MADGCPTDSRHAPPRSGDGIVSRPFPVSCLDQVGAAELEAILADGLDHCFEIGAPVHCELPPENPYQWESEFLPLTDYLDPGVLTDFYAVGRGLHWRSTRAEPHDDR